MNVKNIRAAVKNRYRISTKMQMNFELSFPKSLIGKCRFTADNTHEIRTQKVSLSSQGVVFSDTIPLSWFTSSVFIPWEKVKRITHLDTTSPVDGISNTESSSVLNKQPSGIDYRTLHLSDPREMTIDIPWSKTFTDCLERNRLFDV